MLIILAIFSALCEVNLFIGTGGFGFGQGSNSPYAMRPFGMARVGPDTTTLFDQLYFQFSHFGGYHYSDDYLQAISHMHLVGAGEADLGMFSVLPIRQQNPTIGLYRKQWIDKSKQIARPGYYSTTIQGNITIQLTATTRAGVHHYSCPGTCHLYFMPNCIIQRKVPRNSTFSVNGTTFAGIIFSKGSFSGRFGGMNIHIYGKAFGNIISKGYWKYSAVNIQQNFTIDGNQTGFFYKFAGNLSLYVGVSYVSVQNAKLNLENQTANYSPFATVLQQSQRVWRQELARFQFRAVSSKVQTVLDTAVYRTLQSPTIFQDANGQYLRFDMKSVRIKPANMRHIYTDLSLWDVHRTQMPWMLLHDAQRYQDVARSISLIGSQGGYLPKWPFANGYTGCMIGAHSIPVLADWLLNQGRDIPVQQKLIVFSYMEKNANIRQNHDQRPQPTTYINLGYVPYEGHEGSSVSQTVQLSYDDFCISKTASLLNLSEQSAQYSRRSKFYKNLWNNKTRFFEPRFKNGSKIKFGPFEYINVFSKYYVEGDAWHYRFYAPHDPEGLAELFGGKSAAISQLIKFFQRSKFWKTNALPNPYYWSGNQHDLLSVWLFSEWGRPDLTQKYQREVAHRSFTDQPDGIPGNDDYGTMSAWVIFAGLGFYPIPATSKYILGSPLVTEASLYRRDKQGNLRLFQIGAKGNSAKKWKVDRVLQNGVQVNQLSYNNLEKVQFMMANQGHDED